MPEGLSTDTDPVEQDMPVTFVIAALFAQSVVHVIGIDELHLLKLEP